MASPVQETLVQGLPVLDYLLHGSEAMIELTTPIGQNHAVTTTLIGSDRQRYLYFVLPELPAYQRDRFFVEGYRLSVSLISERGNGAMVAFPSQIEHLMVRPLPLFTVKLPNQITLYPLRGETRYPVCLTGSVMVTKRQIEVQLRDLSIHGCSFSTSALAPAFTNEQPIMLRLESAGLGQKFLLSGTICNQRRISSNTVYGVRFDREGMRHSQEIFKWLRFDGSQMVFREPVRQGA